MRTHRQVSELRTPADSARTGNDGAIGSGLEHVALRYIYGAPVMSEPQSVKLALISLTPAVYDSPVFLDFALDALSTMPQRARAAFPTLGPRI
jgi:hypothetical protein